MHRATARVSAWCMDSSMEQPGGKRCAHGARAACVAEHHDRNRQVMLTWQGAGQRWQAHPPRGAPAGLGAARRQGRARRACQTRPTRAALRPPPHRSCTPAQTHGKGYCRSWGRPAPEARACTSSVAFSATSCADACAGYWGSLGCGNITYPRPTYATCN